MCVPIYLLILVKVSPCFLQHVGSKKTYLGQKSRNSLSKIITDDNKLELIWVDMIPVCMKIHFLPSIWGQVLLRITKLFNCQNNSRCFFDNSQKCELYHSILFICSTCLLWSLFLLWCVCIPITPISITNPFVMLYGLYSPSYLTFVSQYYQESMRNFCVQLHSP